MKGTLLLVSIILMLGCWSTLKRLFLSSDQSVDQSVDQGVDFAGFVGQHFDLGSFLLGFLACALLPSLFQPSLSLSSIETAWGSRSSPIKEGLFKDPSICLSSKKPIY